MIDFEKKILEAFINRQSRRSDEEQKTMRLRSISIFPEFENASPDDKTSYLEAAEAMAQKGLITLKWEKYHEGEKLKTLTAPSIEKLFHAAGEKDPKTEAEEIRLIIKKSFLDFKQNFSNQSGIISFLDFLSNNFNSLDVSGGMNAKAAEDFISLLEYLFKQKSSENFQRKINLTPRALSIKLYSDSKRLEKIIDLANPLINKAKKQGQSFPDISFLERSLPETLIAGKLIFEYKRFDSNAAETTPSLTNSGGCILGFPLSSAEKIESIRTILSKDTPTVLTVENKETFYALASSTSVYDCFLYTGGYPNRAAAAFIKTLSASGFSFFHAGDLDPDGILILQNVCTLAGKPVTPVGMDAETFNRYLPWARVLDKNILRQAAKINDDTKKLDGIEELLNRIIETEKGVEQEIIEYEALMRAEILKV